MGDLSLLTTDAVTMKYILVIEMFTCAGRDDDAVLTLGIFKDLEKACRKACRSAEGDCQVRVVMRWEERS